MNCIRIQEIHMFEFWSCSSETTANCMPIILLELFMHSSAKKPGGTSNENPPTGDINFLLKGGRRSVIYFAYTLSPKLVNIIIH